MKVELLICLTQIFIFCLLLGSYISVYFIGCSMGFQMYINKIPALRERCIDE